jgi:hypothetical protein
MSEPMDELLPAHLYNLAFQAKLLVWNAFFLIVLGKLWKLIRFSLFSLVFCCFYIVLLSFLYILYAFTRLLVRTLSQ